jgi:cytochrome P450
MSALILPGALTLAAGAVAYTRKKGEDDMDKKTNGIPGTRGMLPVIDQTLTYGLNPRKFLREHFQKYGPVFRTRIVGMDMICVSGVQAANLVYCNEDLFTMNLFAPVMKLFDGFMLIQNGKEHKKSRNLIVRALTEAQLRQNLKGIAEAFHVGIEQWAKAGEKGVEIYYAMKRAILGVMMKVLFGDSAVPDEELETLVKEVDAYGRGLDAIVSLVNVPPIQAQAIQIYMTLTTKNH